MKIIWTGMENDEEKMYVNPPAGDLYLGAAVAIAFIIFGFFVGFDLVWLSLSIPIIILVLSINFYRDVYTRPDIIVLKNDGMLFKFNFLKREEFIPWYSLRSTAYQSSSSKSPIAQRIFSGGAVYIGTKLIPITIAPNIVLAIREHYYRVNGQYPNKESGSQ
jgi:hypothetical protein